MIAQKISKHNERLIFIFILVYITYKFNEDLELDIDKMVNITAMFINIRITGRINVDLK